VIALSSLPALWLPLGRAHFAPIWSRVLGTAVVVAGLVLSIGTAPRSYAADAVFSALFYRILPASAEPGRILAGTQIPASWCVYSDQHAFDANGPLTDPRVQAQFIQWFGPLIDLTVCADVTFAAWKLLGHDRFRHLFAPRH
jgi:hypothetical protein